MLCVWIIAPAIFMIWQLEQCIGAQFVLPWILFFGIHLWQCPSVGLHWLHLSKAYWSPHLSPQSSMLWQFIAFLAPSPRPYIDKALGFKVLGMGGDVERGLALLNQVVFLGVGGSYTVVTMSYTISIRFIREWLGTVSFSGFLSREL